MKSWLELFRISNLPTVWTNIAAGAAIGCMVIPRDAFTYVTVVAIILAILAGTCLYSGGMVLNDVFDIDTDRKERPDRPIPSGRIPEQSAGLVGWGLLLAGIGFAGFSGMGGILLPVVALVIAVLSVLYNGLHERTAWAIAALALCRALLYPLGALACAGIQAFDASALLLIGVIGGGAFVHTVALSLVARGEMQSQTRHGVLARGYGTIALAIPPGMVLLMMFMLLGTEKHSEVWPWPGIGLAIAFVILLAWLARNIRALMGDPPRVLRFILGSIAAFCLYDAAIVAMLPAPYVLLALIPLLLFAVVHLAHRSIPGT